MESCCAITVVAVFTEQDSGIQKTYPLKREFASQCFQGIVDNTTTVQIFVNNQSLCSGCFLVAVSAQLMRKRGL